jgi:hypothetical protein
MTPLSKLIRAGNRLKELSCHSAPLMKWEQKLIDDWDKAVKEVREAKGNQ